jgi:hypothetical protein
MALTASLDIGLGTNPEIASYKSRGYKFYLGRLTGTYGGALTTMTVPGINNVVFVSIPPASGFMFDYNVGTSMFALRAGSVSLTASYAIGYIASGSTTLDLTSFTMAYNGVATTGIPFFAVGM